MSNPEGGLTRFAKLLNTGSSANKDSTMDDSKTTTRLLEKNWSPLVVRKYQALGWPLYIGVICDANLSDLDSVVYESIEQAEVAGFVANDIQAARNFCGYLSDKLKDHYNSVKIGCVEGLAVLAYWDKCFISSLFGDFMTHGSCKQELFSIINVLAHI